MPSSSFATGMRVCLALALGIGMLDSSATEPSRFRLSGSGTLSLDQPTLKNAEVQLRADLAPADAVVTAAPLLQANGRFALTASLAAASSACYNDTIFRDGFDGDGL